MCTNLTRIPTFKKGAQGQKEAQRDVHSSIMDSAQKRRYLLSSFWHTETEECQMWSQMNCDPNHPSR